jgi:hypothetical protein
MRFQSRCGLWSLDTSMGANGNFSSLPFDEAGTNFHALTTGGIRGRDTLTEQPSGSSIAPAVGDQRDRPW